MLAEIHETAQLGALRSSRASAIDRLWQHDLSFVLERVVAERRLPRKIAEAALIEYRKFMTLFLAGDGELHMLSAEVDEIWHAHLLFTRDYHRFCEQLFGHFVHHDPIDRAVEREPGAPDPRLTFFRAYRALFGEPSYLWGAAPVDERAGAA